MHAYSQASASVELAFHKRDAVNIYYVHIQPLPLSNRP